MQSMLDEADESDSGAPIALPQGVQVKRDLAYGPDDAQRIDVYVPAGAHQAPVLFMVHGGAWMLGDKASARVVANKVAFWLPKGYILVSVNYRLRPPDPLRQVEDVAMALAFVQAQAASWGGDSAHLVVMGHSAGAHLVSLLASDPSIAGAQGAKPWLGTVALDSAAMDVVRIMQAPHLRFYDRVFRGDPSYWRSVSPLHRLSAAPRPMLLVCSSQRADSCPQAQSFAAKVTQLGGRVLLVPIDKSHREINADLGLPGTYTDAVAAFMHSLGVP